MALTMHCLMLTGRSREKEGAPVRVAPYDTAAFQYNVACCLCDPARKPIQSQSFWAERSLPYSFTSGSLPGLTYSRLASAAIIRIGSVLLSQSIHRALQRCLTLPPRMERSVEVSRSSKSNFKKWDKRKAERSSRRNAVTSLAGDTANDLHKLFLRMQAQFRRHVCIKAIPKVTKLRKSAMHSTCGRTTPPAMAAT